MTDIATERALKLHEIALSVLRVKGTVKLGLGSGLEYRGTLLNIEWRPDQGQLDIWSGRRVLSVVRFRGKPQVIHYVPEVHLINAAKVAA
jgi:hypothetical protein